MLLRTLISFLLFLLLSFGANKWYQKNFCCDSVATTGTTTTNNNAVSNNSMSDNKIVTPPIADTKTASPYYNRWGSDAMNIGDTWPKEKNKIIARRGDKGLLEISGAYYADEINNTQYANLGIARAEQAKKMMGPEVDLTKVKATGKLLSGTVNNHDADLNLLSFNWVKAPEVEIPDTGNSEKIESVEKIGNEVTFRFPYKSTKSIVDSNISDYLKKLALRLKTSDEKVYLVGHTDSKAPEAYNLKLGMKRAQAIKSLLIGMGVDANRIITSSKGESEPVASEDTERGKQLNRRVTLTVK